MTKQLHFILLLSLSLLLSACSKQPPAPDQNASADPSAQQSEPAQSSSPKYRIVTFAPTLTDIIQNLGLIDSLVGVGEYDMLAPKDKNLPVLGTFINVDTERLLSLKPTHVFMLTGKDGPPTNIEQLANAGAFKLFAYDYPATIDDVLQILDSNGTSLAKLNTSAKTFIGPNIPGIGQALDRVDQSTQLKTAVLTRLHKIMQLTKDLPKPRVLMLFSLKEPVMASGTGSVNDQLLEIAGGANATGDSAVSAPTFDRESLVSMAPDVIFALLPDVPAQKQNDPRLANLASLPIPAAKHDSIFILNSPTILVPGINLYQTAATFAVKIHPELTDKLNPILNTPITEPLPEDAPELQSEN
ncbi:ABC transporter substrate-binding protein [Planctomycetota bacterium]|nr:ABC transporter substrate-binding protein [Planctomycetota bacterium]